MRQRPLQALQHGTGQDMPGLTAGIVCNTPINRLQRGKQILPRYLWGHSCNTAIGGISVSKLRNETLK